LDYKRKIKGKDKVKIGRKDGKPGFAFNEHRNGAQG
jgi:hypothetical protein